MALTSSGYFEKNNFSYWNVGMDPDEKKNSKSGNIRADPNESGTPHNPGIF